MDTVAALSSAEVAEHWIDANDRRIHDESVDRTTGGTGRIHEMPLSAVRKLDAGEFDAIILASAGLIRLGKLSCELECGGIQVRRGNLVAAEGLAHSGSRVVRTGNRNPEPGTIRLP